MEKKQIKRLIKIIGFVVGLIVVLLLGLIVFIKIYFSHIASYGVKKVLPEILGVPAELKSASFSLTKGDLSLHGFVLGNPPEFQTDSSLKTENFHVKINLSSIFSDTVVIEEILIQGIEITYEAGMPSNLGKIKQTIDSKSKNEKADSKSAGKKKKIYIKKLIVNDAEVRASIKGMGGKSVTLKMPDVIITDIGKESQGVTFTESVDKILTSIFESAIKVAEGTGTYIKEGAKEIKDKILNLFN